MKDFITFFTQSSEDPEKTSATLTGILIAAASWLQQFGTTWPVINTFFASQLGQQTDQIMTSVGMIVGGIWFLFGLLRKGTNAIETKVIS